jgi:hypothetical protein
MLFTSDLPPDMEQLIAKWRNYIGHKGMEA